MKLLFLLSFFVLNARANPSIGPKVFTIQHDGHERTYLVHVPKSYTGEKPVPLLFVFHGAGDNMHIQAQDKFYWQISSSEKYGHIAVFPNGDGKDEGTFNARKCCGSASRNNMDDVGFTKRIIEQVRAKFAIDPARIYSTGMSNGGMMSYVLACELSDLFSGIAPVAAIDTSTNCSLKKPVSVIHIHAKDDDLVYFHGKNRYVISVPDSIEAWKKLNGCKGTPKKVFEVPGAHCDEYSDCKAGSRVRLCLTDTGKHSWPEGTRVPGQNASEAVSASDLMWDFFNTIPVK